MAGKKMEERVKALESSIDELMRGNTERDNTIESLKAQLTSLEESKNSEIEMLKGLIEDLKQDLSERVQKATDEFESRLVVTKVTEEKEREKLNQTVQENMDKAIAKMVSDYEKQWPSPSEERKEEVKDWSVVHNK